MGMININEIFGKSMGTRVKNKTLPVKDALKILIQNEADKLLDEDVIIANAIKITEESGIVFLDEIDKICNNYNRKGSDVSREGVQRDLLPLIEGTSVTTKYGSIRTDHILFIASGAFHLSKPSDMIPELQGRLPNRVELRPLTHDDFRRILTEPEASLILQYTALLKTENVTLEFTDSAIDMLASMAVEINSNIENIGARRLHTLIEKLLEEISFNACNTPNETFVIDHEVVKDKIHSLAKNTDLSRYIL